MFKTIYNLGVLNVEISPKSALLIKGIEAHDPLSPDMSFIRMTTGGGEIIFLPGSSLKGVVRSMSETLLRSIGWEICDSTDAKTICSGTKEKESLKDKKTGKLHYRHHCLACRTFGSTDMASRVEFSDFIPPEGEDLSKYLVERPGVSIDRRKGSVRHGPFQMEVLTGGKFEGKISFTNYQLWQVGLVLSIFELLNEGFLKLGYAKSRGPGEVNVKVKSAKFRQFGPLKGENLSGVGLISESFAKEYDLLKAKEDKINLAPSEVKTFAGWTDLIYKEDKLGELSKYLIEHFSSVVGG